MYIWCCWILTLLLDHPFIMYLCKSTEWMGVLENDNFFLCPVHITGIWDLKKWLQLLKAEDTLLNWRYIWNKILKLTQCVAGEKTLPCAASHRAHTEYISGCSVLVFLSLLDKLGRLTKFYCSFVFAQFLTSKKQWHVTEWARNI